MAREAGWSVTRKRSHKGRATVAPPKSTGPTAGRPKLRAPLNPDARALKQLKGSSKNTYAIIQQIAVRECLAASPNPRGVADPNDLIDWFIANSGPDVPIGTVLPRHAAIKRLLIDYGYTSLEIRAVLPKPHGKKGKLRTALSEKQLVLYYTLVAELDDPMRTLLRLLPMVGLRVSEICGLTKRHITVRGDYDGFEFTGKGDKPRFVPFSPEVKRLLDRYVRDLQGNVLFPGRLGDPLTRFAVSAACKRLAKLEPRLGKLTPHVLRHTFATLAVEEGVDTAVLQRLLGHENIKTTQIYAHVTDKVLGEAMQRMGRRSSDKGP